MRYLSAFLFFIFIFIIFNLIGSYKDENLNKFKNRNLKIHKIRLEHCIDIENKTKRNNLDNIELSEYCIKEYGYKK